MSMDLNYLKKLIKMLDTSNLSEIEIQEEGIKIRLSKPKTKIAQAEIIPVNSPIYNQTASQPIIVQQEKEQIEEVKEETHQNHYEVKSPMVGTFYRAPSPEAEPYVKTGSTISPGMVLCIIEAMKLMNEIESEVSGKIVKVLVENGQPVEYNQPLFLVELQ